jgi:hypothetical protein
MRKKEKNFSFAVYETFLCIFCVFFVYKFILEYCAHEKQQKLFCKNVGSKPSNLHLIYKAKG